MFTRVDLAAAAIRTRQGTFSAKSPANEKLLSEGNQRGRGLVLERGGVRGGKMAI